MEPQIYKNTYSNPIKAVEVDRVLYQAQYSTAHELHATNECEKNFFNHMNRAVFDKSM